MFWIKEKNGINESSWPMDVVFHRYPVTARWSSFIRFTIKYTIQHL